MNVEGTYWLCGQCVNEKLERDLDTLRMYKETLRKGKRHDR